MDVTLAEFVGTSRFRDRGGIVTDLDGTAVIERAGRIEIAESVEFGLKRLRELGRPVVLNTMRFPLSVMRTFGEAWLRLTGAKIPTVSLNGSQIGYVTTHGGELAFEEIDAFPLRAGEIDELVDGVRGLLDSGVDDLLVFHYPRDWREGELIWTPVPGREAHVLAKYPSASHVHADAVDALHERLHAQRPCMVFMLVDVPEDRLMAYQHTKRSNFFTRKGVDKAHGAREMARSLDFELAASIGAGDAELDTFLEDVGLALIVGNNDLAFGKAGRRLRLRDPLVLGDVLFRLADLCAEPSASP
ncbi:MAG TPA: HAD family phosphatase [Casimicrobiaceae bacterium]|nr:HAD family phosphatase [Casimicrobiaceae bacterium]